MHSVETIEKCMDFIGRKSKDKMTGYYGVIDAVRFDLYGSIHFRIVPPADDNLVVSKGKWFDVTRIRIID